MGYFEDTLKAIQLLKTSGYTVFAVEQAENSTSLDQSLWRKTINMP